MVHLILKTSAGKTAGLFLRMTRRYFSAGRYVIPDSGFYVLKGLIPFEEEGCVLPVLS